LKKMDRVNGTQIRYLPFQASITLSKGK